MHVTSVTYSKLINTGNYEHEELAIEVAIDLDEDPHAAVKRAKAFVESELKKRPTEAEWVSAKKILENPDQYRGYEVKQAQQVKELCEAPEEIPF